MNAADGPVVLAADRQLQGAEHLRGLFFVVWGGLFAGIPLAMLFGARGMHGESLLLFVFPAIGLFVFFTGLYLTLKRGEVRYDATRDCIEQRSSFLGSTRVEPHARRLFDRVSLSVEVGEKELRTLKLELRGVGAATVPLGDFSERNEALTAGMRAARRAGLAFEEKREGEPLLHLAAADLAALPAAASPEEQPWWQRPTALALVAANLVPVLGVLFWGWHILSVVLLFWIENLIVGAYNIAKILLARGTPDASAAPQPFTQAGSFVAAVFFTFHYGMFCAVHGLFVVSLFGRGEPGVHRHFDMPDLPGVVLDLVLRHGLAWAVIALAVSHGLSFYVHYLKPRAYEDAEPGKIMMEPYKRVVILHVVIIAGGMLAAALGNSVAPLLLLIVLKTALDLNSHRREHATPYEREMRDYLAEHAGRHLQADPPPGAAPAVADRNDQPLAHYAGAWRSGPETAVPPGWIARADFAESGGRLRVRLWSQEPQGLADEGEFDAVLRGNAGRVEYVEVRQRGGGRVRIARFTGSDAGADRVDLNEIQHPEGKPSAMQARSLTLQRA